VAKGKKLMLNRCLFIFLLLAASLIGLSCKAPNYNIDKTSPNGTYRIKIDLWEEDGKGTRDYTERLKVQYLKGPEVIYSYESENSDQYEPSMREGMQEVEWVSDNVVRVGRDRSGQPYADELIVANNTGEHLTHVGVSYGRYQSFRAFDLAPGSVVTLYASPEFNPNGTSNYFLGYGGMTRSGRRFEGVMESKQRKSRDEGPLKFHISISEKDSHWY
jgi:hypothetical protein